MIYPNPYHNCYMYTTSNLSQKVESIAEKDYVTLPEDTLVAEAAKTNAE